MTAALYALQILEALPALMLAGQNIVEMVASSSAKLKVMIDEKRDPTEAEWEELNGQIDALRAELHAP